jgi:putative transcription factor
MLCEMCSTGNAMYKADVEGAKLSVCEKCARYGKVIGRVIVQDPRAAKKAAAQAAAAPAKRTETVQMIKNDYYLLIRKARDKMGLNQIDFAKHLNEKESVLHKIESGHMKPDLELARKLEKALKIVLVEQVEIEPAAAEKKGKSEGLTLGDLITIK